MWPPWIFMHCKIRWNAVFKTLKLYINSCYLLFHGDARANLTLLCDIKKMFCKAFFKCQTFPLPAWTDCTYITPPTGELFIERYHHISHRMQESIPNNMYLAYLKHYSSLFLLHRALQIHSHLANLRGPVVWSLWLHWCHFKSTQVDHKMFMCIQNPPPKSCLPHVLNVSVTVFFL